MVAYPVGCTAFAAGAGYYFHRQFRHRLGALSVLVKDVAVVPYSGPPGVLIT